MVQNQRPVVSKEGLLDDKSERDKDQEEEDQVH